MTANVLVEVALLCEGQMAVELIFEWTNKRSLFCVDAKVVIEIMPLAKVERASRVIALQNFEVAVCFGILELKNTE